MIALVIRWSNDVVMVFDDHGEQVCDLQGRYEEVRADVLNAADAGHTTFAVGHWAAGRTYPITRGQWAGGCRWQDRPAWAGPAGD